MQSLNTEASLNVVGRFMQYQRILNSLKNRLRTEYWLDRNPEIADEALSPPLVIVAITRTGTTMLHRILASDRRFYAPLWYEVRNPAPYEDWQPTGEDRRIIEARGEVLDVFARGTEHTLDARAGVEAQFHDIRFEQTVAEPERVVERIYDFIDLELTPEARAAMAEHRDANRRSDRPAHAYTLEEYGYTEAAIRRRRFGGGDSSGIASGSSTLRRNGVPRGRRVMTGSGQGYVQ